MRVGFSASYEQRKAIRLQQARLSRPEPLLEIVRSSLPPDFAPASVTGSVQSMHPDRFVTRVDVRSAGGEERVFAVKAYADDFGKRVWTVARMLVENGGPSELHLPSAYVPQERALVFPWVEGEALSDIVDERKPQLLRQAADLAARLHRVPIVPDAPTTAQMMVDDALGRCDRLRIQLPETVPAIGELMAPLQEAFTCLDPADLAPVHGDLSGSQFLWTGDRLVLLDLDMCGYTDPAYDAGHFLAQQERRCLLDSTLPAHSAQWLDCFRDTYLAAMPHVSARNVAFYHGLTLIRKIYTLCTRRPEEWTRIIPPLAARARAALEVATTREQTA